MGSAYTHDTQLGNKGNAVGAEKICSFFARKNPGLWLYNLVGLIGEFSVFVGERLQFSTLIK